jgi:hypothetical protein
MTGSSIGPELGNSRNAVWQETKSFGLRKCDMRVCADAELTSVPILE